MVGETLGGRYRIERVLGTGGMGSVYAATDLDSGRTVAVKVIHKHLAEGKALVARFEREARAAGSIDTDHIARCFDTGTDPETGSPFMVLEYLVGEDLQHLLRRLGPLMPEVALRIVAQACVGVGKAHEAGVVHRDLKPANLFLARGEDGSRIVKVLDFGVAKMRRDDDVGASTSGGLTRTGSMLGSPLYMSPEQARSVKNVDHRSDIWSMGVVLYQSLAGRTPFEHISGLGDLILALCTDLPPPVQRFAPWVSPEIAEIVDRTLRIAPDERYQTIDELLAAIRARLPDVAVRDEMLEALDDETHDFVAPTYSRRGDRAPLTGVSVTPVDEREAARPSGQIAARGLGGTEVSTTLPASSSTPASLTPRSTPAPSAHAQTAASTPGTALPDTASGSTGGSGRQVSVIAIAVACVVAGGSLVYAFTRPGPAPGGQPSGVPVPLAATASPKAPQPPITVTPTTTPTVAPVPGPTIAPAPITASAAPPPGPTASASTAPSPSPTAPGRLLRLPTGNRPRPAPSASAPRADPLDYSAFGGRK